MRLWPSGEKYLFRQGFFYQKFDLTFFSNQIRQRVEEVEALERSLKDQVMSSIFLFP